MCCVCVSVQKKCRICCRSTMLVMLGVFFFNFYFGCDADTRLSFAFGGWFDLLIFHMSCWFIGTVLQLKCLISKNWRASDLNQTIDNCAFSLKPIPLRPLSSVEAKPSSGPYYIMPKKSTQNKITKIKIKNLLKMKNY